VVFFYLYLRTLDKWDTLLKALFECSQSPNAALRESAFRIFASVPELIAGQHTDALKNVFLTSLTDAESQAVSDRMSDQKWIDQGLKPKRDIHLNVL
jgi:hypothetical protein